jgi:hypothetical protein
MARYFLIIFQNYYRKFNFITFKTLAYVTLDSNIPSSRHYSSRVWLRRYSVRRSFYCEDFILYFYCTVFTVIDLWKISNQIRGSMTRQANNVLFFHN